MQSLKKKIADIIYDADWEIRGVLSGSTRDIRDHYLVDEEEVIDNIIAVVKEALPVFGGNEAEKGQPRHRPP